MHNERELKDFDYWKIPRPSHDVHGADSPEHPISENLKGVNPRNWRQEGNQLIADTDMGPLVQTIPVDYLLEGTDDHGLPKFRKVVYSSN